MIRSVRVYETDGKQFPSLEKAVEHRENLVEEFFRKTPGFQDVPMKKRIAFIEHVLQNRDKLAELLSYGLPSEEEDDGR